MQWVEIKLTKAGGRAKKAEELLEKVEQDADITRKQVIDSYLLSSEFDELLLERAGDMHAEGYADCLKFVGEGSVVISEQHSIEKFRIAELAQMQAEEEEASRQKGGAVADPKGPNAEPEGQSVLEPKEIPS